MGKPKHGLTDKQYNFCLLVGSLKCSSTEAYARVYNSDNMKRATIRREASRLLASHIITTTIQSIKEEHDRHKLSLSLSDSEKIYDRLRTWIDHPPEKENASAQLRSVELLMKALGIGNSQTVNMNVNQEQTSEQIKERIESLLIDADQDKSMTKETDQAIH